MTPQERPREIWTRFAVDPIADPLARILARHRGVTPNRVTGLAFGLACGAACCFAVGVFRVGGALFLLRFFADCLDGKIAREQRSWTAKGAAIDIAADVVGIVGCAAALAGRLISTGRLDPVVGLGLVAAMGTYNWALSHRKHLAERAGLGIGGTAHDWAPRWWPLRWWVGFSRRMGMSAVPWAVEAEIGAFGLAPLMVPVDWLPIALLLALVFYLIACVVNLRRIESIAGALDAPLREEV